MVIMKATRKEDPTTRRKPYWILTILGIIVTGLCFED